jgi:hypothetical protein
MDQVDSINTTSEIALHTRLKDAGMRLHRVSNDHYSIVWRHQEVCRGLTLLAAAKFIDRALSR